MFITHFFPFFFVCHILLKKLNFCAACNENGLDKKLMIIMLLEACNSIKNHIYIMYYVIKYVLKLKILLMLLDGKFTSI